MSQFKDYFTNCVSVCAVSFWGAGALVFNVIELRVPRVTVRVSTTGLPRQKLGAHSSDRSGMNRQGVGPPGQPMPSQPYYLLLWLFFIAMC